MAQQYQLVKENLRQDQRLWLVTGVAGFIGSHLLETLLTLDQRVVGLDNFSTGYQRNLDEVKDLVGEDRWSRFRFIQGDITDLVTCRFAVDGVRHVLHQAALGSVPRSIADPIGSNATNVTGFLNMLVAARDEGVGSFNYAASSSTYGDHPALPKVEDTIGRPLSPYAVTKYVNELYAEVFVRTCGFKAVGLRYFNVYGPRQDPEGSYAAVIPKWISAMLSGEKIVINGDGETTRDFCFVANAVQANLLAAVAENNALGEVYNVAVGDRTSLNQLHAALAQGLNGCGLNYDGEPRKVSFRPGDVRHSQADISKAQRLIGYQPTHRLTEGLVETLAWHLPKHNVNPKAEAHV